MAKKKTKNENAPVVSENAPAVSEKPVKKKMKPRGGNYWLDPKNYVKTEPGDNAKYLSLNVELMKMPNIDINNPEEVQQRLIDYFMLYAKYDMKPTVSGMAVCLNGHTRSWLWGVTHDKPTGTGASVPAIENKESTALIKRAYTMLETLWENYMQAGKINPVSGIFLGKNNYNYQDKTEYVVTPNQQNDSDYSADEIRERYLNGEGGSVKPLPETIDSDNNSDDSTL